MDKINERRVFMIDIEVYRADQRFRRRLAKFTEWWTLLADKKAGKRTKAR